MYHSIFVLLFLLPAVFCAYCPSLRTTSCSSVYSTSGSGCAMFYEFTWDSATGFVSTSPKVCAGSGPGYCHDGAACEPPCSVGKVGGPNGMVCSQFTSSDCAKYYAYRFSEGADKWCVWVGGVGCTEPLVCHD